LSHEVPEPSTEPEWDLELIERAINGVELPRLRRGVGLRDPGRVADHLVGQAVGPPPRAW
jgi:hypothetical protein